MVLSRALNVDTGNAEFDKAHRGLLRWEPKAGKHTAELIPDFLKLVLKKKDRIDGVSEVIGRILPAIMHYREMLKSAISDPFLKFFWTRLHVY